MTNKQEEIYYGNEANSIWPDGFRANPYRNYYYVDKTRYIAEVERNASFFFLIRPRRFGKSLFLNVLRWYYDVNRKDSFEELFGDLYIGSHPTPEQGQYLVLDFNFAGVNPDPDELIRSFNDHCAARFREFAYYYERFFNPGFRGENGESAKC